MRENAKPVRPFGAFVNFAKQYRTARDKFGRDRESLPKAIGKKSRGIPAHLVLYFPANKKAEPLRSLAFTPLNRLTKLASAIG